MPAPPRKEKPIVDATNSTPTWMVTMGDTMSLLLCFFVMMLNFGSLHSEELANLFGAFSGGNHSMPHENTTQHMAHNAMGGNTDQAIVIRVSDIPARLNDLKRRLAASGFRHHVGIDQLNEGLRIRFAEAFLFGEGGGLTDEGRQALADVLNILQAVGNEVRLLAAPQPSMDSARALAVADYLADEGGLRRSRIGIGDGDGEDPTFAILLMEKAGTKELRFADLWNNRSWQR